jgi:hypothetical protein
VYDHKFVFGAPDTGDDSRGFGGEGGTVDPVPRESPVQIKLPSTTVKYPELVRHPASVENTSCRRVQSRETLRSNVQNRRDVVAATLPGGSLFGKPGHDPVVDYNLKVRLELAILLGAGREKI